MNPVFADTSYFIALAVAQDEFHEPAHRLSQQLRAPLLTTSAIVHELGAYFSHSTRRPVFLKIVEFLTEGGAEVVHVDEELHRRGLELFPDRPDKNWSLADCISFEVMKDRGVVEAATSDEHFEQAQFIALLRLKGPNH